MNSVIILLDNPGDWKPYYETNSVLTVSDYLKHKSAGSSPTLSAAPRGYSMSQSMKTV